MSNDKKLLLQDGKNFRTFSVTQTDFALVLAKPLIAEPESDEKTEYLSRNIELCAECGDAVFYSYAELHADYSVICVSPRATLHLLQDFKISPSSKPL